MGGGGICTRSRWGEVEGAPCRRGVEDEGEKGGAGGSGLVISELAMGSTRSRKRQSRAISTEVEGSETADGAPSWRISIESRRKGC
jgi:hypothetical protein